MMCLTVSSLLHPMQWSPFSRAFIDVRIFYRQVQSNWNKGLRTREVKKANSCCDEFITCGMVKEMAVG